MLDRFEIVDNNFKKFVCEGNLPPAKSHTHERESGLSRYEFLDLVETQFISRHLDYMARRLKTQNQSFYTIGSAGHEGNAASGKVFSYKDMAFLHYRSGAQYIQRAKQITSCSPIYDLLLSFVASSDDPIAGGRHKVFGSKELNIPPQTSTIASHLPKSVGAALSIGRAKALGIESNLDPNSVILCTFGDASVNHAVSQAAFNTASWMSYQNIPLPLVFSCEDNDIGISVPTPPMWIENSMMNRPCIKYFGCDGLNLFDVYLAAKNARDHSARTKKPSFHHMKTVRLLGHAGSDVETLYHSSSEIEDCEFNDPLLHSARIILENNYMSKEELLKFYESLRTQIEHVAGYSILRPKLRTMEQVKTSIVPSTKIRENPKALSESDRKNLFDREWNKLSSKYHMAKIINFALMDILGRYNNTVIFGEDVARKGGVYHVTAGLFQKFGIKRVFNSLLDETSILGTAIGLAHNGFVPIPEIQFLAYVHNAEDQIRGEASTLSFFSNGQYTNGMVIRIAGLAYQKGFGGHFHNDNSLAVLRDIPGMILAVPSNGADAAKMLRTCVRLAHEFGRLCVFVEPIALYMTKDLHTTNDNLWLCDYPAPEEEIPLGEFNVNGDSKEIAIITYGNGFYYSLQAVKDFGKNVKVIDLRWLSPIDMPKVCKELDGTKKILVVEECRKTGSMSELIVAGLVENFGKNLPKVKVIAAEDCFIPLGVAAAVGLPSKESICKALKELDS